MRFFLNSYLVAGVVTLLTVAIATLTAYAFSRYQFRLKNPLNVFIVSTRTVPPITLLIPYFGMVVAFGIFEYLLRADPDLPGLHPALRGPYDDRISRHSTA